MNDRLKQRTLAALDDLHADTTVSRATTRERIKEVRERCDEYIQSLAHTDEDADELDLDI